MERTTEAGSGTVVFFPHHCRRPLSDGGDGALWACSTCGSLWEFISAAERGMPGTGFLDRRWERRTYHSPDGTERPRWSE